MEICAHTWQIFSFRSFEGNIQNEGHSCHNRTSIEPDSHCRLRLNLRGRRGAMATLCNFSPVSCSRNFAAVNLISEINIRRKIRLSSTLTRRPLDFEKNSVLRKRIASRYYSRICSLYNPSVGVEERKDSDDSAEPAAKLEEEEEERRTVGVFWDLDNKPPKGVPPYNAATSLRDLASEFGIVVDMVAYANQHAFTYVPQWIRDERQERKRLNELEEQGAVQPAEPYICQYCGRKCQTYVKLKKHFQQLHERERNKRLNHLKNLKGKRRQKFKEKVAEKEDKYQAIATRLILPKKGYGLAPELKRAGVYVRTVEDRPQAADEALIKHMTDYINKGLQSIILVSDDSDFINILRLASRRNLQTIVIGDLMVLSRHADISFSWDEVASGRAHLAAAEAHKEWTNKAELIKELEDDSDLYPEADDEEESEYVTTVRPHSSVSAFSEEESFDSDSDEDGDVDDETDEDFEDDEESLFEDFSPWSSRIADESKKVY